MRQRFASHKKKWWEEEGYSGRSNQHGTECEDPQWNTNSRQHGGARHSEQNFSRPVHQQVQQQQASSRSTYRTSSSADHQQPHQRLTQITTRDHQIITSVQRPPHPWTNVHAPTPAPCRSARTHSGSSNHSDGSQSIAEIGQGAFDESHRQAPPLSGIRG